MGSSFTVWEPEENSGRQGTREPSTRTKHKAATWQWRESGGQSPGREGLQPGHPQSSSPKPMGAKGSVLFRESSSQNQLLPAPRRGVSHPLWRRWKRLLRPSQPVVGGQPQAVLEKRGTWPMQLSLIEWRTQERKKGVGGGCWGWGKGE